MLKNSKKLLIVFSLFISASIAAWFVFFAYGTRWLEAEIAAAIENLRGKGYVISYSTMKFSGNPFSIQAIIQNPHLKDPQGLLEWQGQDVKVAMRPWEFYTLRCSFSGDHTLVVPPYGGLPLGALHLEEASAIVHLSSKGRAENVSFNVNHLSSILGGQPQPITLKDLSLTVGNMADPLNLKLSISTQLENIEKFFNKSPSSHPFTVSFVAELSGFNSPLPSPKSLAEWRDGGGVLEVRHLKIDWPPILAEIEGTLTLDEDMYPLGSFSSQTSGYEQAINDMVDLGWIKRKKATVALFMLDLLSSSDAQGVKRLNAPIRLQNKRLSIGPAPLLKLKPIEGI